ncbi:putative ALA-interacting subunit 2 [Salvia splendens]|uniref:putative ALA-interacting subunit 2 n=1 Tax=Salvia splendens TaxID=180675 RepID=UPI001C278FFC|nr:putative ALA-interacting subunit 2 [Salvia splendens]XP_042064499.1 putative ALA-interacting subunit 2 [Salvia splendens]
MEEGRSTASGIESDSVSLSQRRSNFIYQFTQQSLPACKPVLSPVWVVSVFFVVGVLFIPVGIGCLHASRSVVEIVYRYDVECIPAPFRGNKLAYIANDFIPKNCTKHLQVPRSMKAPIYVYYQLDNYYQNHRRYYKSRSERQLLHGLEYPDIGSCAPEDVINGLPVVPCGLVAWSMFNDTFSFFRGVDEINVNRKNIAWKSDRDHKFGKHVFPFNFQNGSLIGGARLDPNISLSDQEDLIVWMRTSALPSFRKLYGRIEKDLDADDTISVKLLNNYNTYSFSGSKKIVLSTSSWLGGHNNFLGIAYLSVGSSFIFVAFLFLMLHIQNPRSYVDTSNISWNRKHIYD